MDPKQHIDIGAYLRFNKEGDEGEYLNAFIHPHIKLSSNLIILSNKTERVRLNPGDGIVFLGTHKHKYLHSFKIYHVNDHVVCYLNFENINKMLEYFYIIS